MSVKEIQAKSIISKSGLPESDYAVNPYVGCLHDCTYCYARFMSRFTGHAGELWGSFVDVKVNAPELMEADLKRISSGETILLSSVTDAYQPLEQWYGLTRRILETVTTRPLSDQPRISILTKSDLVLRDVDILTRLRDCNVGLSFSTTDDDIRRIFEPYSVSVKRRVAALKELKTRGIETYVFLGPILPEISNLRSLFEMARECQVDWVMAENLNLRGSIWPQLRSVVEKHFPELLPVYTEVFKNPRGYWPQVRQEINSLSRTYGLPTQVFFEH